MNSMLDQWKSELRNLANPEKISVYMRFFKTGPGEYGEGDTFIGLGVPQNRAVSKNYAMAPFEVLDRMFRSPEHEYRLASFLALVARYRKCARDVEARKETVDFYLAHADCANNWDLVDLSAPYILGEELAAGRYMDSHAQLRVSPLLWHRRIAVVSMLPLIRKAEFELPVEVCEGMLGEEHQLMRKAVGWMLREIGKKNIRVLDTFLEKNIHAISATTLSYAIERHTPEAREAWRKKRKQ